MSIVPTDKMRTPPARSKRTRVLARPRAQRFSTWASLHAAVIAWCWEQVERAIGSPADREQWRATIRHHFREIDAEPRRLWNRLRDALVDAIDYLDKSPELARSANPYVRMLDSVVSFRCVHAIGAAVDGGDPASENVHRGSIRGMVEFCRKREDGGPEDWSLRRRIVGNVLVWQPGAWWWPNRKPKIRDVAILSLLAGNVPEGTQKRQRNGTTPGERPTVLDVVAAEESAVRAALSKLPSHLRPHLGPGRSG